MITIRKSIDRGYADHGWLKSLHTFSFANYYDPKFMGFRKLRVINEDKIAGSLGFDPHPHRDMEIISYVVSGGLLHKDSMGNITTIRPGEVQRMSAGTGIVHSEYNAEKSVDTHFFQIWILPNQNGVTPGYGQKSFESELNSKKLVQVISNDGKEGTIEIKQDADLYISRLKNEDEIIFSVRPGRGIWIQLIKGKILINNQEIIEGDAASCEEAGDLKILACKDSEFLLFDIC